MAVTIPPLCTFGGRRHTGSAASCAENGRADAGQERVWKSGSLALLHASWSLGRPARKPADRRHGGHRELHDVEGRVIRYVWLGLGVMAVATFVACGADTTPDDPESLASPSASHSPGHRRRASLGGDRDVVLRRVRGARAWVTGLRRSPSPISPTSSGPWGWYPATPTEHGCRLCRLLASRPNLATRWS